MVDTVEIANNALRRLGKDTITSFTEGTKSANAVNDVYDETLDTLLNEHDWNCATTRVELAQLSNAPAYGFDHAYALPSDWIRSNGVHANSDGTGTITYKEEFQDGQNVLLADADQVFLTYIFRQTDPNRMSPLFRRALSRRLAQAMAIDLTNSNVIRRECEDEADKLVRRARSVDAQGSTPGRRPRGSWADSRNLSRVDTGY